MYPRSFFVGPRLGLFGLALLASAPVLSCAAELWVSPTGNDTQAGVGTKEQPFASVAMALRKARELRRLSDASLADGVRIVVRGGVYPLDRTLVVYPEDSGTEKFPTRIEAAPGEKPVLSGGLTIEGWRKTDTAVPRLPESAKGHVWVAPSPRFNGRILEFRQLWVNRQKAVRARQPNGDVMERLSGWDRRKEEALIPAALVGAVKNPATLEMVIQQQWEVANLRVALVALEGERARLTFHQPESRLEFAHPWPQPILQPEGQGAFFLTGAPEFLDQPGEWHHDVAGGRVYYWPREGENMAGDRVIAPALQTLFAVGGTADRPVTNVQIKGIAFQHATWMRPSLEGHVPLQAGMYLTEAYKLTPKGTPEWRSLDNQAWIGRMPAGVEVRGAQRVRFERCRFEHMGASGLDFIEATQNNTIEGCVFRDLGGNGLQMGSFQTGEIETHLPYDPLDERELCARERIANNLVTDVANEDWGCVGILVGYAREVTIEHNEVNNVSYTAISLGWGWTRANNAMRDNRVHANHLHHYATRMCDTAGVYTLSAQPGTIVSENSVHSVSMSPYVDRPDHWFYLYLDEGSSFIVVRDNWCEQEKFLKNSNGPGNEWINNGPMVSETIKTAAGLEMAYRDLLAAEKN